MQRHIIHIHIPSFSIAVARVCRAELRDRPVAVAPLQSKRALIMSVSGEALKGGIFKGMSLSKAIKSCPGLTVLPPNPGLTQNASQALARVVSRYSPLWEPARPGHVYLDITGTERLWGSARDAGYRLREEVKQRLSLSGTVGVAGNKMLSNIASRIRPDQGVLNISHGHETSFMAPLKVDVVPGIGPFRKKILLEDLNIVRVRELAAMDIASLKLIFGRQASVIHQRALGIDPTPVYPAQVKPMVSEETTLQQDENDDQRLLRTLYSLVEKCACRLRYRKLSPGKAGMLIRYSDQVETRRRIKLPRNILLYCDVGLYHPLKNLFLKLCDRRVGVRFIKVWFWDFSSPGCQLALFDTSSPARGKKSSVTQALDNIRNRYGEGVIKYGRTA